MKLSLALKQRTKFPHQQLEKILLSKLKSISAVSDYVDILNSFYGYIKPLETFISTNIDNNLLPDYNKRRKSDALQEDLRCFDSRLGSSLCHDLPTVNNTYQALGALYVLEGSTLGGQIISRMIAQKLQLQNFDGLAFFKSYGDETLKMWDTFKQVLDEEVLQEDQHAVIETAEQTFIKFKNWLA